MHTSLCVRPIIRNRILLRRRLEELEGAHQIIAHSHHRPRVVELTAVVRGAEKGHHLPAREELVPVLDDLGEEWRFPFIASTA